MMRSVIATLLLIVLGAPPALAGTGEAPQHVAVDGPVRVTADLTDDLMAPRFDDVADLADPHAIAAVVLRAANSGQWGLVVTLGLVLTVWAIRRWPRQFLALVRLVPRRGDRIVAWLTESDRGSTILVFAVGLTGALGAAALAGKPVLTLALWLSAIKGGVTAIGAYHAHRQLTKPRDKATTEAP